MYSLALLTAVLLGVSNAQFSEFLTRPGQKAVALHVLQNSAPGSLGAGYIFITPYETDFQPDGGKYGPHIFDDAGNLIGVFNYTAEHRAMDAHVCGYAGSPNTHICYTDADPAEQGGHSVGVNRFFDNTYTQVGPTYGAHNGLRGPDIHELNTPVGQGSTSFIQDVYQIVEQDLSVYKGPQNGYVLAGCFQEIEFSTNKVIFQWCSTDHVPLHETFVYLLESGNYTDAIAGDGTIAKPWDYFHINAIGKDMEGNYIVSSRQFHTLFKVAGVKSSEPGSIIWRLGGKGNEFKLNGFNFSWQHDARWREGMFSSGVGVTLFDNGFDGTSELQSAQVSNGLIIDIDEAGRTASLKGQYLQPGGLLVVSQGSTQPLPNGNVFMGWGAQPYVSEHAENGDVLYYATFAPGSPNPLQSYRAYKQEWTGHPAEPPSIFAYAEQCRGTKYVYASFNGATEVAAWNVFTGNSTTGPWTKATHTFKKFTYETDMQLTSDNFAKYAYVEALDKTGAVLRKSKPKMFYIPKPGQSPCGAKSCGFGHGYSAETSIVGTCGR